MRIDRTHCLWFLFVLAASAGAGILFLANFHPDVLPFPVSLPAVFGEVPPKRNTFGGTPLGLLLGGVSFLIFLFASALGIRKKRRLWPIGNVKLWLKAHIWLTILTVPLVLMHCGFHFGGVHTSALMMLYGIVMVSGFVGLGLQQVMPRMMKLSLSREVVFEQIPHLGRQIYEGALGFQEELMERGKLRSTGAHTVPVKGGQVGGGVQGVYGEMDSSVRILSEFVDKECLPYLSGKTRRKSRFADGKTSEAVFRALGQSVSGEWQGRVQELYGWCEQRRLMDLQTRMQHWLHGWLVIHVPFSFVLLVWTAWHAWVAVRLLVILPD
jgi:hypothetical protein